MNVLFFYSHPFNPSNGGIERVTDCITRSLLNGGDYEVFHMCGHTHNKESLQFESPVAQYCLPYDGFFENTNNVDFFLSFVREHKIDVVVNQGGAWTYMNNILGQGYCKYISVIHCAPRLDVVQFKANYFHLEKSVKGYCKWLLKLLLYPIYGMYLRYQIIRRVREHYNTIVRRSDLVVVLSKYYISELEAYIGLKSKKICCINNPNSLLPTNVNCAVKDKIVLYVGRLDAFQKQPKELLKVWKKIYNDCKEWKLVFVGDGDNRATLENYVRCHNLARVYFEGKKDNVDQYYDKASILCLVSRIEGQPMVLTEGMGKGCVPVSYDSYGAVYDIIDDGVDGYIIPYKDTNTYAKKLKILMLNSYLRNKMSQAAYKKAKQFSLDKIVCDWKGTIKNLVGNHNS